MTALSPEAAADASYALGLWTGWGLLHSVLATRRVKAAFALALGPRFALYPLGYTLISLWTFWLVLVKEPDLPQMLWAMDGLPKILLYAAQAGGLAFLAWAGMSMGGLKLLGLSQLWSVVRGRVPDEPDMHKDFSSQGAYALVRHPMHTGGMLFLLAAPRQTLGGLVFALFGCGYMLLGTFIEERRLAQDLGQVWTDYASRVPMFLPNLLKHQN
jgi:methanethiol S-methyltransferase